MRSQPGHIWIQQYLHGNCHAQWQRLYAHRHNHLGAFRSRQRVLLGWYLHLVRRRRVYIVFGHLYTQRRREWFAWNHCYLWRGYEVQRQQRLPESHYPNYDGLFE